MQTLLPPLNRPDLFGPYGPAYVQVYDDGSTASGWGESRFMAKYDRGRFSAQRATLLQERHGTTFALVMRSACMICIDIDGKNGGFDTAAAMLLPPTLAETSRSGNGYHLFYQVNDTWDASTGFGAFKDRIGLASGVDIRGTGCVFHHPKQQWNTRVPAQLTPRIRELLEQRTETLAERVEHIKQLRVSTDPDDEEELLMIENNIQSKLTKPIPTGRRNTTLFALGAEMAQAQINGWEKQVYDRGIEIGLGHEEMTKLIANVRKYS